MKATEHRLEVEIGGTRFAISHVITHATYSNLDPKDASHIIETFLWDNMMHTIEHHLRKNLTHA
jgi:hypothetical protein